MKSISKSEQSKIAYDRMADNYENTSDGRFTYSFKKLLIAQTEIKDGDKLLDVACGNGELLNEFSKKVKLSRAVGIDISPKMVEVAKGRLKHLEFFENACEPLPFDNEFFDVLTVSASFHHFPSPNKFLREARRVLKVGGKLIIAEVQFPIIIRQLANLFYLPFVKSGDVKIYSKSQLKKMIVRVGFDVERVYKKGNIIIISCSSKVHI